MAMNREITPLTKANTPRSCTMRKENSSGELRATSPTMIERTEPLISQPRLLLFIVENGLDDPPIVKQG
jgi:hypothetical protein